MNIGFIGLGNMGKPMAKNLLKNGFSLTVYDIDEAVVNELVSSGAKSVKSAKEVAENSDTIIMSLPTPKIFEEVALGENGVLKGVRKGQIIIDMGTDDPMTVKRVAKVASSKGVALLDSPVSGGVHGAEAGTLSIMVGGDEDSFKKCKKIYESIGRNITYVGESGNGSATKLVNNICTLVNIITFTEALALGKKYGLDPQKLHDVIKNSSGTSKIFERKWVEHIVNRDFEPGFKIDLAHKDLGLAIEMSRDLMVPLFVTSAAVEVYELARAKGLGKKDTTGVIPLFEEICKIKI
jgi:3-hydroxyisobutyrate dehydrogenase